MIGREDIAELARLYDQFHGAFDPLQPEALRAEQQFMERLAALHAAHAADVPFHEFRRRAVQRCKELLRNA